MFKNFSKFQYFLNGQTLEYTDIFKSIKVNTDNFTDVNTVKNYSRKRPDQLSESIYNDYTLYWSLFLLNNVRNPFKQWNQTPESLIDQNAEEYKAWYFQFANNSSYLPGVTQYYETNALDSYLGVTLSGIEENDILIYDTGDTSLKFKVLGAGSVGSTSACAYPNFGQSIIPDNFVNRNQITSYSAGGNFTATVDNNGKIWGWGENIGLTKNGFELSGSLYKTVNSGFTLINTTKNKLTTSSRLNPKQWYCYGDGCTTGLSYPVTESKNISQLAFTKGTTFSGILLFSDNTIKTYGGLTSTEAFNTITSISCAESYCLGIIGDSGVKEGKVTEFTYSGLSAGLIPSLSTKITKVACGNNHALLLDEIGTIYFVDNTGNDRTNIPSGTYIDISAGDRFSAAINSNNTLYLAGQILKESGSCSGSTAYVAIKSPSEKFESINAGYHHLAGFGGGESNRHIGRVSRVDNELKRIEVFGYSALDSNPVLVDEPSGTLVSVWRDDVIVKTIQHQLNSIDSYLNTTQYVKNIEGQIINLAANDGLLWKNVFITGYKNHLSNSLFITPLKIQSEVINNQNNIKFITNDKVYLLENALNNAVSTTNKIEIKMSEL